MQGVKGDIAEIAMTLAQLCVTVAKDWSAAEL